MRNSDDNIMADDEPKRGRGRPKLDEARDKQIMIRLTAGDLEAIESAAAGAGISTAAWVRERALEAIGESDLARERAELAGQKAQLKAHVASARDHADQLAEDAALLRTRLAALRESLD